mmetsp:Transcript_1449/g.2582  ORF Transcript_1449/g.2582 Transcript_1449/m.2582 type:complete len:90 (-) Transcript_1449:387-656(-)
MNKLETSAKYKLMQIEEKEILNNSFHPEQELRSQSPFITKKATAARITTMTAGTMTLAAPPPPELEPPLSSALVGNAFLVLSSSGAPSL